MPPPYTGRRCGLGLLLDFLYRDNSVAVRIENIAIAILEPKARPHITFINGDLHLYVFGAMHLYSYCGRHICSSFRLLVGRPAGIEPATLVLGLTVYTPRSTSELRPP